MKKVGFFFFFKDSKKKNNAGDAETDSNTQSNFIGCFFVLKTGVILDSFPIERATDGDLLLIP